MAAGSKFTSISPNASPTSRTMIEREGSDTLQFSAANTGAASQGVDESVGPALAESNLEHAGEDVVVSLEERRLGGWWRCQLLWTQSS